MSIRALVCFLSAAALMMTLPNLLRFPGDPLILLALTALAAIPEAGQARDTVTPAIGYFRFDCPSGSDTHLSVPFQRPIRWSGKLSASPSAQAGSIRLTLAGAPSFAADELIATSHLIFIRDTSLPGGRHFAIVAHGSATVDVAANLADLSGLTEGDLLSVVPAWTLATLFPPSSQTTFHISTGPLASQRGSELLFFNEDGEGVALAPSRRFFVTSSGWIEVGDYSDADDVVILPNQPFVVRHREGAAATTFVPFDEVSPGMIALPLGTANGNIKEARLAPPRPVPVSLDQLGLTGAVFTESTGTAPADRKDELFLFDGTAPGINRTPSAVYFRSGGQWLRDTAGFPASGGTLIEPAEGLLIRKAAGTSTSVLWWENLPIYNLTAP